MQLTGKRWMDEWMKEGRKERKEGRMNEEGGKMRKEWQRKEGRKGERTRILYIDVHYAC